MHACIISAAIRRLNQVGYHEIDICALANCEIVQQDCRKSKDLLTAFRLLVGFVMKLLLAKDFGLLYCAVAGSSKAIRCNTCCSSPGAVASNMLMVGGWGRWWSNLRPCLVSAQEFKGWMAGRSVEQAVKPKLNQQCLGRFGQLGSQHHLWP